MSDDFSGPRVTELGMLSIGLVAAGVIDVAGHFPRHTSLAVPAVLLAGAAAVLAANLALIARRPGFAWWRFLQVARWMLVVYAIVAGMIEFAFLYDRMRGGVLVVMTLLLAVFMLNVPLLVGYTVARFEQAGAASA